MTIASEIERLQCAKSDIRQAIIDKGVSIASELTIDNYACCIDSIPTGSNIRFANVLVVGGGGGGGTASWDGNCYFGGGGGGGAIKFGTYNLCNSSYQIVIGAGGAGGACGMACEYGRDGCNGGASCISGLLTANGGKGGCGAYTINVGKYGGESGSGNSGGAYYKLNCHIYGGGGGGAFGSGCIGGSCGCGGIGCNGMGGGGGGGGSGVSGICGGGSGGVISYNGCKGGNASCYGGGGGGSGTYGCCFGKGGDGCQGVVKICYIDGVGIKCATGGTKSTVTENGITYCMHTFTSNGTFCIIR